MKSLKRLVLAGALTLVMAHPAHAQTIIAGNTYVGGTSFTLHAWVSMTYTFNATTNMYSIALTVQNLGVYGEVYKSIGLVNVPKRATVTSPGAPAGWVYPTPNNGGSLNGLPKNQIAYWVVSHAPAAGLQPGAAAITFNFNITGVTLAQVQSLGAGVHAISGPNGCSSKLAVVPDGSGGYTTSASTDANCMTAAPEPATFFLLGTGLLGLGVVGYRRRRLFGIETEEPKAAA